MEGHTCYGLELEGGRFYVGIAKSYNLKLRCQQHFTQSDMSSKWCRLYKPVRLIYKAHFPTKVDALKDEKRKVVELMRKYGIRKVRGADALCTKPWCYQPDRLFWVPFELREKAKQGLLGKLDVPNVVGDF